MSVGENNEVTVEAQVEAVDFISSVAAHCIKAPEGGDIGPDEPLMEGDPIGHPGLYSGQITARKPGSFRIKATATFADGAGTISTTTDEDGDYHD